MEIHSFYDNDTSTFSYVVTDENTNKCAVIDSVLNYDQFSGRASTTSADAIIDYVKEKNLQAEWILETHVHADHITAAHYLRSKLGGKIAMGTGIKKVLSMWVPIFEIENDTCINGQQYDHLFAEGEQFNVGSLIFTVWHTPGHTPACVSYLVDNAIFVGDTLFPSHLGTARCDFPGGSAEQMYNTIQRFYTLPDTTQVYLCHDYPEQGNAPSCSLAIIDAKKDNLHIKADTSVDEYVQKRQKRDQGLAIPKLLLPAIQANLRNGQFGQSTEQGAQFIKIPVNKF